MSAALSGAAGSLPVGPQLSGQAARHLPRAAAHRARSRCPFTCRCWPAGRTPAPVSRGPPRRPCALAGPWGEACAGTPANAPEGGGCERQRAAGRGWKEETPSPRTARQEPRQPLAPEPPAAAGHRSRVTPKRRNLCLAGSGRQRPLLPGCGEEPPLAPGACNSEGPAALIGATASPSRDRLPSPAAATPGRYRAAPPAPLAGQVPRAGSRGGESPGGRTGSDTVPQTRWARAAGPVSERPDGSRCDPFPKITFGFF
ncbi:unnamed protein product [Lepidochelys kempii]